ncbi:lycopene cyclase domain-containing protein [Humidisolicoccus flavus]|uniref:lycopene cyclase domain-containing protein n=1 Tax=Humidisolicoccus flavus TaxID=3111414 RepID=UPI00324FD1B6
MTLIYLGSLLFTIGCMALIDARWKLAFWHRPGRAALAVGLSSLLLLIWDLIGIGFGIFFRGDSPFMTGIEVIPDLPIEEFAFLIFLSYFSLILYTGVLRILASRREATS